MAQQQDPAVSVCFMVEIDNISLGAFNSCDGLGCEVVMEQREEGGNNGYVWQLPTRIKYSNIKLSRPVTRDTEQVTRWLAGMLGGIPRKTAHITAMTVDGTIVARWSLMDVVPVRWSGPSLSPETPKVATETLEIAHHGFLNAGR
ncbi:phage tail protein [Streptomyces sp. NPDC051183]|uniref:phage tail protein n=1 Tax=unclassified Streptomyces TaxID=2593676 RepID=UPI003432E0D4